MRKARRLTGELGRAVGVLRLIARGETLGEIARQTGTSRYAVRKLVGLLLAELGARNREHAVALAFREGLLR
jgi:DNA-binding CsgD family transcriptional regulator